MLMQDIFIPIEQNGSVCVCLWTVRVSAVLPTCTLWCHRKCVWHFHHELIPCRVQSQWVWCVLLKRKNTLKWDYCGLAKVTFFTQRQRGNNTIVFQPQCETGNNADMPNGAHIHRGAWNETFKTHILGKMTVTLDLTLQTWKKIQLSIKVMTLHASDF